MTDEMKRLHALIAYYRMAGAWFMAEKLEGILRGLQERKAG